jgi:predicted Zn finger-like uncharacterized protein
MRLTCPNCDAQYEVDDSAIPDTGRDVQCSNCGHAWFQLPPDIEAALEAEEAVYGAPAGAAPARSRPAAQPDPDADADEDQDEGDLPPVAAAAAAGAPSPRRALDENLMAILREEAEREAAARQAERARTIETQPDLGIGAPPPLPRPAASPPAQIRTGRAAVPDNRVPLPGATVRPTAADFVQQILRAAIDVLALQHVAVDPMRAHLARFAAQRVALAVGVGAAKGLALPAARCAAVPRPGLAELRMPSRMASIASA